jgi:hypothetical protein
LSHHKGAYSEPSVALPDKGLDGFFNAIDK